MDVTRELTAAQRRKQRRLRSWWRREGMSIACALAEALHQSSGSKPSTCDTRVVEVAGNDALRGQNTVTTARWERPAPVGNPWSQKRIQQHTVEQFGDLVPMVQILDNPVPLMVDVLIIDRSLPAVAEQVTEVPKIILQDSIPQRTVLRSAQVAEQLVEVPTVTFSVEPTVDIPVQGGVSDLREDPLGFLSQNKNSSAFGGAEHQGQQGFLPKGSFAFVKHNTPVFTVLPPDSVQQCFVLKNIQVLMVLSQDRVQQRFLEVSSWSCGFNNS